MICFARITFFATTGLNFFAQIKYLLRFLLFIILLLPINEARASYSLCKKAASTTAPTWVRGIDNDRPITIEIAGRPYTKVSKLDQLTVHEFKLDANSGLSEEIEFEIPKDADSFSINIHSSRENDYSYVYKLVDPQGREIISAKPNVSQEILDKARRGQAVSPNAMQLTVYKEICCTPVPNSPQVEIIGGLWKLTIARDFTLKQGQSDNLKRKLFINVRRTNIPEQNRAFYVGKLNLFLAPGNPLGPAVVLQQMKDRGNFEGPLGELLEFYKKLDIHFEIGNIRDIDKRYNRAFERRQGGNSDAGAIRTDFAMPGHGFNLFFLKPSNYSNPGIASYGGSGYVYGPLSQAYPFIVVRDNRRPGEVASHEIGHYLGLYHTNVDGIEDTQSHSHVIHGDEGFVPNLMDVGTGQAVVTPGQKRVLQKSTGLAVYMPVR